MSDVVVRAEYREPYENDPRTLNITLADPHGGPEPPDDVNQVEEFTRTLEWALSLLRTLERNHRDRVPEDDLNRLHTLVRALDQRLIPALEGVRDAAVRRYRELGGSYGSLAKAMGVPRSTAQTRSTALLGREPSAHERWASGE
ncbi:hypothetical protein [Streptomyces flavofungini]|uniref:Uncharacterized protein n=1 Tax=Streptomyces flavofungini TaxID=68200 RepID=A0ABS0X853_9ACTN|nr:hypothetical protein [Streptomyces flavofungini]MBJ3809377.1 hypothetical protein [Streptomyces flavofungini]GHC77910.1 hypothetical protein GCM10010349_58890 [Streptomyces flavofungini]